MSAALHLSQLLPPEELPVAMDPLLTGLTVDSRHVQPGEAFIALAGATTHGLKFADAAIARGAAAILFEPPAPADLPLPEIAVAVPQLRQRLGALADRCYDAPSAKLAVIGVTGTNGKTSTVQLLSQALSLRGQAAGSIGTLGAGLFGALRAGERTTPDVVSVHRLLAELREQGAEAVAMEVSSHALDQGRVDAVAFRVAVFTNLSRDHLDYHGDMTSYGAAKARLFAWPGLKAVVANLDDAHAAVMLAHVPADASRIGVSSRGGAAAVLRADDITLTPAGIAFTLVHDNTRHAIASTLLGRFNVDNLLAVAGSLLALGLPTSEIAELLPQLSPVAGRMNRIGGGAGQPLLVVDYAHTPDALAQTLQSLRAHTPGRLSCVFGCGGERDRGKRPQMAAIAEQGADACIVTDDNPRGEDGDAIVAEIMAGFSQSARVRIERDRARAIAMAVSEANAGDVVLIAGKGHEPYQEIAGRRLPFDDLAVAKAALEARACAR